MRKCRCYSAIIYFLLMIAILTFIVSYISFLFRINISGEYNTGADSVTGWANHLLPPLFLLTLTRILKKMIKLPDKLNKTDEDKKDDAVSLQFDEKLYSPSKLEREDTII